MKTFNLYDLNIKPCTSCYACKETHKCVINDDQKEILDAIGNSEVVVFSSPTYWSNVSAPAKAFIDRTVLLFNMTKLGSKRTEKNPRKALFITACFAPFPFSHFGTIQSVFTSMKRPFDCMKTKKYCLSAPGVDMPSGKKLLKLKAKAYRYGTKIA